jgi:hypothetical protein
MDYQLITKSFPLLRWWRMMLKHLERRDASDSGWTVLVLIHMLIMFLRISEQGETASCFLKDILWPLGYCLLFTPFECRWVLLEVLDKISPGSVNWKQATKPPIKMPFRKVENCNQVISIGKDWNFSLVNVAGNDIVQGNKKLILGEFCFPFLEPFPLLFRVLVYSPNDWERKLNHTFLYCSKMFTRPFMYYRQHILLVPRNWVGSLEKLIDVDLSNIG